MATFTWTPSKGFNKKTEPDLIIVKFGDGYSQRTPAGINALPSEWSLSFNNRSLVDADNIITFLEAREGSEPFTWTPTGEASSVSVYCDEWSTMYTSHISRTIKVVFKQVYEVVT